MSDNPYSPTQADLVLPPAEVAVPPEVLKKIKNAWIVGVISGTFTLVFSLLSIVGVQVMQFSAAELVDAVLAYGLAYGIYRKSRTCAILLTAYFIIGRIVLYVESGVISGGLMGVIFLYFLARGIEGTFQYHKLMRAQDEAQAGD
ncbi:MAG: hypothetical protein HY255_07985 [Betaproteobacteria bacterium]|nr:hypothetical protein [Betaproteobacteria bacterium]